jgi:2-dehydropantoate 2-reductase
VNKNNDHIRFIIYGAGGIGCVIGGHLSLTGKDVVLLGRPGHVNTIQEKGLYFLTPAGTHTLQIPAYTSPRQISFQPDDVVLLCMKSQNTEDAVKELNSVVKDITVFCCQNGVRNEEISSRYLKRVYGVMIRIGAVYVKDGEVLCRRDPPGWMIMGNYPRGNDALVHRVARDLSSAGFMVMETPDVMPYKWGKLMMNLANAIGAITGAGWGECRNITSKVQEEARGILAWANIPWKSEPEIEAEWSEYNQKPRATLDSPAQSSSWQSLARQQGSVETGYLNGEIVRIAAQLGEKAPLNDKLLHLMEQMAKNHDLPGKYTAAELEEMLGLR